MRFLKFFATLVVLALCCGSMLSSPSRSHGFLVSEVMGVSALKTLALSEKTYTVIEALGYGFGAPSLVHGWQAQQWLELEYLLARNDII